MPLILFGWPDMAAETTRFAVEVPYLGSLILTHSLNGQVPGLKQFPPEDRPNSTVVFWTFRVMVGHTRRVPLGAGQFLDDLGMSPHRPAGHVDFAVEVHSAVRVDGQPEAHEGIGEAEVE